MDIIWLKRDVRLHNHGPLSAVAQRKDRKVCILYLYEPDQLAEPTVHGSHIAFINEGLLCLDGRITTLRSRRAEAKETCSGTRYFQSITVCHSEAVEVLQEIHKQHRIGRVLAHQETGHYASFERDKRVRRWCRQQKIPCIEFQQSGVTRCLSNRDDFSKNLNSFLNRTRHPTPSSFTCDIVADLELPGRTMYPLLDELEEISEEYRVDRPSRQVGGETEALMTLQSFLEIRGCKYAGGISSPNSSWSACSRLSAYLSWGHVSIRKVHHDLKQRQEQLRHLKKSKQTDRPTIDPDWLKSLASFASRIHWRAHFMQKLESEPMLEKRDLCPAYQHLRQQPCDWNEEYYQAWAEGRTGFPFVDACMRCLHTHGWLNFRMRAMLVSFATYNLWLDWKRIAPHLARLFLDYEPGIHYPQLQMQAGTTGINAMRVYSVTKQGKDQDHKGIFIRKYVPELESVPDQYIHEPWRMPQSVQTKCGVLIGHDYPQPIVNEQESARVAKQRLADVRKREDTKRMAEQVYVKHGSRSRRSRGDDRTVQSLSSKRAKKDISSQQSLMHAFLRRKEKEDTEHGGESATTAMATAGSVVDLDKNAHWNCHMCTFLNENPVVLACSICGTPRKS